MSDNKNPAVAVAKKQEQSKKREVTLSTGVRVRLLSVSPSLIMDVQNQIRYPEVPKVFDKDGGKEYDNPDDPGYKLAVDDVDNRRGLAAMDAMIMFGVELLDEIPENDSWLKKLELLARTGGVDLHNFELENPIDLEFLYKKYIAVGAEDLSLISASVGVTEEGVAAAEDTFQDNA